MPIYNGVETYTITAGGGTVNLDVDNSTVNRYVFSGTSVLAASWVIQPTGIPLEGMEFDIRWQAPTTLGANNVTIFGRALSDDEGLSDLTINCYYDGASWDVDVVNNDLLLDTDTPVPFRGLTRTDPLDNSNTATGIVFTGGLWKSLISYSDATGNKSALANVNSSGASLTYNRDTAASKNGYITFSNQGDGVIGVFETNGVGDAFRYGFSTRNETGVISSDFYQYDPIVDLDRKIITIVPTKISHKFRLNIVNNLNYDTNEFLMDEDEFSFYLKSSTVAGVETLSTKSFKLKLSGTVNNIIPALPEYANDAAADADADLLTGALYKIVADRTVYQKP